ncbi:MAG: universal stress protein [Rhodospirillales bacterium]
MAIRMILVPHDEVNAAKPALETAFIIARNIGAHVNALHVGADPNDAVPLISDGMSGAIINEMMALAEKETAERAAKSRQVFGELCSRFSIEETETPSPETVPSASWTNEQGLVGQATAVHGRLSDLIVAVRPVAGSEASSSLVLNAALFETGRPVLVAPPSAAGEIGRKVAISWNGSAESARAVAAAMEFIEAAQEVFVLTAKSDRTSLNVAPELVSYLAWHGVKAGTKAFSPSGGPTGAALLGECAAIGADMLVMGAYTHSRMRQLILGGVTSHVLEHAEVPLLMAH